MEIPAKTLKARQCRPETGESLSTRDELSLGIDHMKSGERLAPGETGQNIILRGTAHIDPGNVIDPATSSIESNFAAAKRAPSKKTVIVLEFAIVAVANLWLS